MNLLQILKEYNKMKKNILLMSSILLFLFSCNNDSSDYCVETSNTVENALENYINSTRENYPTNCNEYKKELENKIKDCGDENGDIQSIINDLGDCTLSNGSLSVTLSSQMIIFDKVITLIENGIIRVFGYATESAAYTIYFEVPVDQNGTSVLQNFVIGFSSSDFQYYIPHTLGPAHSNFKSNIVINSGNALIGTFGGTTRQRNGYNALTLKGGSIDIQY